MKKVLTEYGVYEYKGFMIPNYKDLGLSEDGTYRVLKDAEFVNELYNSILSKDGIQLVHGNPIESKTIGFLNNFTYLDGILLCDINENINDLELAASYLVDTIVESGTYIGIDYDLKMKNPKINNISLVERKMKIKS